MVFILFLFFSLEFTKRGLSHLKRALARPEGFLPSLKTIRLKTTY